MSARGKKTAHSKSWKAGLVFPVARVNRRLVANKTTNRIGATAAVYLTAVIEYCMAELIELAIKEMRAPGGRSRITAQDLLRGVRNDPGMNTLMHGMVVMVGDKAKDTAELILSKTDAEARMVAKMEAVMIEDEKEPTSSKWFVYHHDQSVGANYKRFLLERKTRVNDSVV